MERNTPANANRAQRVRCPHPQWLVAWLDQWRWSGECRVNVQHSATGWAEVEITIVGQAMPWPAMENTGKKSTRDAIAWWGRTLGMMIATEEVVHLVGERRFGLVTELAAGSGMVAVRTGLRASPDGKTLLHTAAAPPVWEIYGDEINNETVIAEDAGTAAQMGAALVCAPTIRQEAMEESRRAQQEWREEEALVWGGQGVRATEDEEGGQPLWVKLDDGEWVDSGLFLHGEGTQRRLRAAPGRDLEIVDGEPPSEGASALWTRKGDTVHQLGLSIAESWGVWGTQEMPQTRWPIEIEGYATRIGTVRGEKGEGDESLGAWAESGTWIPASGWRQRRWDEHRAPTTLVAVWKWLRGTLRQTPIEEALRGFTVRVHRWTTQRRFDDDGTTQWDEVPHEVDLVVRSGIDDQVLVDDEGMSIAIESENGERRVVTGDGGDHRRCAARSRICAHAGRYHGLVTVAGKARNHGSERRGRAGVRMRKPRRRARA